MSKCKTFLFHKNSPWVKKDCDNNNLFDVPMGAFDSCEVCELCGIFLLSKITNIIDPRSVGLYRDDGLAAVTGSGPQIDRLRKELVKLFKQYDLRITVNANVKIAEYLDVKFNLENGLHRPYRKPNDVPMYISTQSNHPPLVLKMVPETVQKRLSMLSSNVDVFNEEARVYQQALKDSGHQAQLTFKPSNKTDVQKRVRRRNIIWFNPPFSANVQTKVAEKFLRLLDYHFPKGSKLAKYFNRNTVKVSYSTTKNMKAHLDGHNKKILSHSNNNEKGGCNCRKPESCPLRGECQHCKRYRTMYDEFS